MNHIDVDEIAACASQGPWDPQASAITQEHKFSYAEEEAASSDAFQTPFVPNSKQKLPSREEESFVAAFCKWIVHHQIGIAVNLLLLLSLTHFSFPKARIYTRKFFELSYYNASSGKYGAGWDDASFIFFWLIIFTGARVAAMEYLLQPLAERGGIRKRKMKVRFAEQAWIFTYDTLTCSLGLFIMYNSDYWFNLPNMWKNWPDREMEGIFKWYYLVQFAFWLQQIVVVNIEEWRKDHVQMFSHHVITCLLMFWSYGYHQTKVGNVILSIMDGVDTLLEFAKMLKYLGYRTACDVAFGVFIIAWFALRHVAYLAVCYSILVDVPQQIRFGCYWGSNANLQGPIDAPAGYGYLIEPFRNPEGLLCQTTGVTVTFLTMLLSLQVIFLVWFWMILNLAWRVVTGNTADDPRSDNEDSEEEEVEIESQERIFDKPPVEEEVGVEDLSLGGRLTNSTRVFKKGPGSSSGVSLPHDRKELLGRIGCDKQT